MRLECEYRRIDNEQLIQTVAGDVAVMRPRCGLSGLSGLQWQQQNQQSESDFFINPGWNSL
jgi:hypothetical protein